MSKLVVAGVIGQEDFSVPKKFDEFSKKLFAKDAITKREYVDFCMLAIDMVDKHWDKRHGLAYHITGAWVKYPNIDKDPLLDEIGSEFGNLELPDHHIGKNEAEVRQKWKAVKKLVHEADQAFPKTKSSMQH